MSDQEFTRDQRSDIVSNTIAWGALSDVIADQLEVELATNVPEHMPADFTRELGHYLEAWLRSLNTDPHRPLDYLWALIQSYVLAGDLQLTEEEGYPYYKLRRADVVCMVCREVHA